MFSAVTAGAEGRKGQGAERGSGAGERAEAPESSRPPGKGVTVKE